MNDKKAIDNGELIWLDFLETLGTKYKCDAKFSTLHTETYIRFSKLTGRKLINEMIKVYLSENGNLVMGYMLK